MSGGAFDYQQYTFERIADEIEHLIEKNGSPELTSWGERRYDNYPPEVMDRFREAVTTIRRAQAYAHRIDWLISGDDGTYSFLRRLDSDLAEVGE